MTQYYRPENLQEALSALQEQSWTLLAGGTDLYPANVGKSFQKDVLDITRIESLKPIQKKDDGFYFGATTTWSDLISADLPPAFRGLQKAGSLVGAIQTQNAGTLCGNICNASPAADGVPNLLALDAKVLMESTNGKRKLPLSKFILGNRKTALQANEMVTGIHVPTPQENSFGNFEKTGARAYLVISVVMVGVVVQLNEQSEIEAVKISVGACSPVAQRMSSLENALLGQSLDSIEITNEHLQKLQPIDDIRASASYRMSIVPEMIKRSIQGVKSHETS